MKIAVRVNVRGIVQGVFFRATLAEVAKEEDVAGWVMNVADGSVEAVLEGEEDAVLRVVEWAKRGPPRARVDSVDVESVPTKNLDEFRIVA